MLTRKGNQEFTNLIMDVALRFLEAWERELKREGLSGDALIDAVRVAPRAAGVHWQ